MKTTFGKLFGWREIFRT